MALAGQGVLAIWNGIADGADADFLEWHVYEHIPERVAVPGFLRGRRYEAVRGEPRYFNFYETEGPDDLKAPAYLDRLNAPSVWTRSVVRRFTDTDRTICSVVESRGLGDGAVIATVRFSSAVKRDRFVRAVVKTVIAPLAERRGIVGVHLLEGDNAIAPAATTEQQLRRDVDRTSDWVLLLEAVDAGRLECALDDGPTKQALTAAGATFDETKDLGIYSFQFGLGRGQLPRDTHQV